MAEPPPDLERRAATTRFEVNVPGFPGLELAITDLSFVVEGVPTTVPSDCECGHGIDAHSAEKVRRGEKADPSGRVCSGIAWHKDSDADDPTGPCGCEGYTPAHAPRELAFKVERLVEVSATGAAALRRKGSTLHAPRDR